MNECMHISLQATYWLPFFFLQTLPGSFCTEHLPKEDCTIALEDEHGESYDTIYLHDRKALSGGWGEFARKHSISVGDDVVFQLDETKISRQVLTGYFIDFSIIPW
jgi:hypothetical protein